jgi:hypothetical protein
MGPADRAGDRRLALVRWAAGLGAVTGEALAVREGSGLASARARLRGAARAGLLRRCEALRGVPAMYVVTPAGLRACGLRRRTPVPVGPGGAPHAIACAWVAAVLERDYPHHRVLGGPDLRAERSSRGEALASARIAGAASAPVLHAPDLVLIARAPATAPPVAVEVELTVKAPRRLEAICRAWARSSELGGVLYVVAPAVERPLIRAIEAAHAGPSIAVVPLGALAGTPAHPGAPAIARAVAVGA